MKQLLNSPIVLRGSKSSRSNRFDCDEELLARLASKNIVMVISPGRCGTEFLQKLLALVPDVFAAHEQEPNFETVLSRLRRNPWLAIEFCRESKLPFIARCVERNYVETSHLFGKGFFEAFLNLGVSFKLIFLHRNPRDVALSHLRVRSVPKRTKRGRRYLIGPDYPGVAPLPGWGRMNDYQLCFWYCVEIERRKEKYRKIFDKRSMKYADISFEDLKIFSRFTSLCDDLEICNESELAAMQRLYDLTIQKRYNLKSHFRTNESFSDDQLSEYEEEVWEVVSLYEPVLRQFVVDRYAEL